MELCGSLVELWGGFRVALGWLWGAYRLAINTRGSLKGIGLKPLDAVEKADFPVAPRDPERHSGCMKTNLKPANSKARALLKKLLALAERGIDGEKTSAQRKIRRLKARFDFSAPDPAETPDLFSGSFKRFSHGQADLHFRPQ